jgi:hypothetical protein
MSASVSMTHNFTENEEMLPDHLIQETSQKYI